VAAGLNTAADNAELTDKALIRAHYLPEQVTRRSTDTDLDLAHI
jgi:hypothetical protein